MPSIDYYGAYDTLADLGKGEYLAVRCGNPKCRHAGYVMPGTLPRHLDPRRIRLARLRRMLRCTVCKWKSAETDVDVLRR